LKAKPEAQTVHYIWGVGHFDKRQWKYGENYEKRFLEKKFAVPLNMSKLNAALKY